MQCGGTPMFKNKVVWYVLKELVLNRFWFNSGTDHIQGQGELKKRCCSVTFNIIIPVDIERVPYMILVSTGIHTHIPPPPWLVSKDSVEDILRIVQPILYPGITRSKFVRIDWGLVLNWFQLSSWNHLPLLGTYNNVAFNQLKTFIQRLQTRIELQELSKKSD